MTLPGVVALAVTLQGVAASLLLVAGGEVRRAAASRQALLAEAVWRTAVADAADEARHQLSALAPGEVRPLHVPSPDPAWTVVASVQRAALGAVGGLRVSVVARDAAGTPRAARQGTLILPLAAADTAVSSEDGSGGR